MSDKMNERSLVYVSLSKLGDQQSGFEHQNCWLCVDIWKLGVLL